MSRLLNAEYACSIRVLVSAIQPPTTLTIHSVFVIPPVRIIVTSLERKGEAAPRSTYFSLSIYMLLASPSLVLDVRQLTKPYVNITKPGVWEYASHSHSR